LNTEARVVALEHEVEELKAEIDRLFSTLFRLVTVADLAMPERVQLLALLGLHEDHRPVDPR